MLSLPNTQRALRSADKALLLVPRTKLITRGDQAFTARAPRLWNALPVELRNTTGVTEEALKEFSMMFKHFDKEKSGRLNHQEFKSCLRSLGYDLPMVEEGEPDPEFESILDTVDPNRDGNVSLQEYMAFMISRETENVKSSEEIESAFRALSTESKPYVIKEELYQNLSKEQADYCISHMKPYLDAKGREMPSAFDFVEFTRSLFVN